MPTILVTNDDGVEAGGLRALEAALAPLGDVYTVAPLRERSGASHGVSLWRTISVEPIGARRWGIDGTPADAILIALRRLLPCDPHLVVAGINHGDNLGHNSYYSGTVSAAVEARLLGIPSMAVSLCVLSDFDFAPAASFAHFLAAEVLARGLDPDLMLSVNVPEGVPAGVRLTRTARRMPCYLVVNDNGADAIRVRLRETADPLRTDRDSDYRAIYEGFISVTPLNIERCSGPAWVLLPWADVLPSWRYLAGRSCSSLVG